MSGLFYFMNITKQSSISWILEHILLFVLALFLGFLHFFVVPLFHRKKYKPPISFLPVIPRHVPPPPASPPVQVSVTVPHTQYNQSWELEGRFDGYLGVDYDLSKASEGERWTGQALLNLLPNSTCKVNYRPNFLKNPRTGHNLEMDFCYVNECIAVEVQGDQHHKLTKFTPTLEALEYQQWKDEYKKQVCLSRGFKFITIDTYKHSSMESVAAYIEQELLRN